MITTILITVWVIGFLIYVTEKFGVPSFTKESALNSMSESFYLLRRTGQSHHFSIWIGVLGVISMFGWLPYVQSETSLACFAFAGLSLLCVASASAFKDAGVIGFLHYVGSLLAIILYCQGFVSLPKDDMFELEEGLVTLSIPSNLIIYTLCGFGSIVLVFLKIENLIFWVETWCIAVIIGGFIYLL